MSEKTLPLESNAPTLYCSRCKCEVTYTVAPLDHKKELMRTIITCGIWLPMWLLMSFARTRTCNQCGNAIDPS